MTFDELLDTWRTQDKSPVYSVNRDLLQLVLKHEQSPLRRAFRFEARVLYVSYLGFFMGTALFFALIYFERNFGDEPRPFWGYILAVAGAVLCLGSGIAEWVSRRRQALRERRFGNTLRDELERHLSLIDYALSRQGRARRSFLTIAPLGALAMMVTLLTAIVNGLPIDPTRIMRNAIVLSVIFVFAAILGSRLAVKTLLPRQQRLSALLRELEAGDERSAGP
jgi:hypothetical protein